MRGGSVRPRLDRPASRLRVWDAGRCEIQDPQATLALNQAFVASDLIRHLRSQPNVAEGAVVVTQLGDDDPFPFPGDVLEQGEGPGFDLSDETGSGLGGPFDPALERLAFLI